MFSELSKFLSSLGKQGLVLEELDSEILFDFISQSKWSNRTQKNVLTTLKCISKQPLKERLNRIKIRRTKSTLHKPIKEVERALKRP